jgi:hypothetical protein
MKPFPRRSIDADDALDWDVAIVTPPARRSGTIRVTLRYAGRSKPEPVVEEDAADGGRDDDGHGRGA